MVLMNDRWRFEVRAPRRLPQASPALAGVPAAQVLRRLRSPSYRLFADTVLGQVREAEQAALDSSSLTEEKRSGCAKALALSCWAARNARHARLAKKALAAVGAGAWGCWCGAADWVIDYLVAADLLRAAGAMSGHDMEAFRERLAPKVGEGFALAPRLPQNNWRIEADCALGMAALMWWHCRGGCPVEEWLAAALDGLNRVLFGLLSADGAYEEGPNYSRRAAIPFIRLAYVYRRLAGVDLLNHPALRNWHCWQVEVKQPDGRTMPYDDSGGGFEGYPHALLANPAYREADVQRWAHDRAPVSSALWAVEALMLFDDRVRPHPPRVPCSRVLAHSGTAIFRSGWGKDATMGLLLARPLIPLGTDQVNTAHRHDDPLHFLIHARGELLAIDPGYGPGYLAETRYTWYLSPEAHNLILVDGEGPPRTTAFAGDCRKGNVSQSSGRVKPLRCGRGVIGAQAETSYCGVDFRRSMFFVRKRYFLIVDEVESARSHEYTWLLHGCSAEAEYMADGAQWRQGNARLTARVLLPSGLGIKLRVGRHCGKGHAEADHVYVKAITGGRNVTFAAVLAPEARDAAMPEVRVVGRDPLRVSVRLDGMRRPDVLVWRPPAEAQDAACVIDADKNPARSAGPALRRR